MTFDPIAADLAVRRPARTAGSARPDAPVVPDRRPARAPPAARPRPGRRRPARRRPLGGAAPGARSASPAERDHSARGDPRYWVPHGQGDPPVDRGPRRRQPDDGVQRVLATRPALRRAARADPGRRRRARVRRPRPGGPGPGPRPDRLGRAAASTAASARPSRTPSPRRSSPRSPTTLADQRPGPHPAAVAAGRRRSSPPATSRSTAPSSTSATRPRPTSAGWSGATSRWSWSTTTCATACASVNVDDRGGARLAAQHLVDLGHRRDRDRHPRDRRRRHVACNFPARERMLGWHDALDPAGIEPMVVADAVRPADAAVRRRPRAARPARPPDRACVCFSDAFAARDDPRRRVARPAGARATSRSSASTTASLRGVEPAAADDRPPGGRAQGPRRGRRDRGRDERRQPRTPVHAPDVARRPREHAPPRAESPDHPEPPVRAAPTALEPYSKVVRPSGPRTPGGCLGNHTQHQQEAHGRVPRHLRPRLRRLRHRRPGDHQLRGRRRLARRRPRLRPHGRGDGLRRRPHLRRPLQPRRHPRRGRQRADRVEGDARRTSSRRSSPASPPAPCCSSSRTASTASPPRRAASRPTGTATAHPWATTCSPAW